MNLAAINALSVDSSLLVLYDNDDTVDYGVGWIPTTPEITDGEFVHLVQQGGQTIQVRNDRPFVNPINRLDVNFNNEISAFDALLIINRLSEQTQGTGNEIPIPTDIYGVFSYIDTNADGRLSALDALLVINHLNNRKTDAGRIIGAESENRQHSQLAEPIAKDDPYWSFAETTVDSRGESERFSASEIQGEAIDRLKGNRQTPFQREASHDTTESVVVEFVDALMRENDSEERGSPGIDVLFSDRAFLKALQFI